MAPCLQATSRLTCRRDDLYHEAVGLCVHVDTGMMDASAANPWVGPPWSRSNGLTPRIKWVARNAGVADPPRDTHIPLRHLNCLAMKDEMDLGVGCESLLTSEHGDI